MLGLYLKGKASVAMKYPWQGYEKCIPNVFGKHLDMSDPVHV